MSRWKWSENGGAGGERYLKSKNEGWRLVHNRIAKITTSCLPETLDLPNKIMLFSIELSF